MTDLDPYRPDANAEERADHVIGVLLGDEDPVRRYRTVQALQDGRLRDVSAISLRQLRDQLGTTDAAAEAVGVTRQAVNELLAKAGAPGAREDRNAHGLPTYWYGQYLAAVRACAEALPEGKRAQALTRWYDLEAKAPQTLTMLPALTEAAMQWLKAVRQQRLGVSLAEARARVLDECGARIADWVAERADLQLTIQEQSEVYIGYHHERAARRQERTGAIDSPSTAK